jgi:hypothetical protein
VADDTELVIAVFLLAGAIGLALGVALGLFATASKPAPAPPSPPDDVCPYCGSDEIRLCVEGCKGGLAAETVRLHDWLQRVEGHEPEE